MAAPQSILFESLLLHDTTRRSEGSSLSTLPNSAPLTAVPGGCHLQGHVAVNADGSCLAVIPPGQAFVQLFTAANDFKAPAAAFDPSLGTEAQAKEHACQLCWLPDGQRLALACTSGKVYLVDRLGQLLREWPVAPGQGGMLGLAAVDDLSVLVLLASSKLVARSVHDDSERQLLSLKEHHREVRCLGGSANLSLVAVVGDSGAGQTGTPLSEHQAAGTVTVSLWRLSYGQPPQLVASTGRPRAGNWFGGRSKPSAGWTVALSPSGRYAAVTAPGRPLLIFTWQDGSNKLSLEPAIGVHGGVAVVPPFSRDNLLGSCPQQFAPGASLACLRSSYADQPSRIFVAEPVMAGAPELALSRRRKSGDGALLDCFPMHGLDTDDVYRARQEAAWWQCQRLRVLQHLDRLETLCAHYGSFDAAAYTEFRDCVTTEAAMAFARMGEVQSLATMLTRHPFTLAPNLLAILDSVPETVPPSAFLQLLPEGKEQEPVLLREPDWVETRQMCQQLQAEGEFGLLIATEVMAQLYLGWSPPSAHQVLRWCAKRARAVDAASGQLAAAQALLQGAAKRGGDPEVEELLARLQELCEATQTGSSSGSAWLMSLDQYAALDGVARLRLVMQGSRLDSLPADLSRLAAMLRTLAPAARKSLLVALLEEEVPGRLAWCSALIQAESLHPQVFGEPSLLAEAAVACVYAWPHCSHFSTLYSILDAARAASRIPHMAQPAVASTDGWEDELDLSLGRQFEDDVPRAEMKELVQARQHVWGAQLLAGLGLPTLPADLRDCSQERAIVLVRTLLARLSRAEAQVSDARWTEVWRQLKELQECALPFLPRQDILAELCRALLRCGHFRVAKGYLTGSGSTPLPPDLAEQIVLAAGREYFYSANSLTGPEISAAKQCLAVLPESTAARAELDTIAAVLKLQDYGITVLPMQFRQIADRMEIMEQLLQAHPDAYTDIRALLLGMFVSAVQALTPADVDIGLFTSELAEDAPRYRLAMACQVAAVAGRLGPGARSEGLLADCQQALQGVTASGRLVPAVALLTKLQHFVQQSNDVAPDLDLKPFLDPLLASLHSEERTEPDQDKSKEQPEQLIGEDSAAAAFAKCEAYLPSMHWVHQAGVVSYLALGGAHPLLPGEPTVCLQSGALRLHILQTGSQALQHWLDSSAAQASLEHHQASVKGARPSRNGDENGILSPEPAEGLSSSATSAIQDILDWFMRDTSGPKQPQALRGLLADVWSNGAAWPGEAGMILDFASQQRTDGQQPNERSYLLTEVEAEQLLQWDTDQSIRIAMGLLVPYGGVRTRALDDLRSPHLPSSFQFTSQGVM
ncbi:hypothetical protein WJX72_009621 [[Myrmecia] bisecta]|uniref:Sec39 domain-containing protein n=1 Tax=[Myrmecia] bisecta TaxID=41462 RepID=A0AAW1PQU7_9CHLO